MLDRCCSRMRPTSPNASNVLLLIGGCPPSSLASLCIYSMPTRATRAPRSDDERVEWPAWRRRGSEKNRIWPLGEKAPLAMAFRPPAL